MKVFVYAKAPESRKVQEICGVVAVKEEEKKITFFPRGRRFRDRYQQEVV